MQNTTTQIIPSVEQWLPISNYEGLYEVSDHGRVRSVDRKITNSLGHESTKKGKILALAYSRNGYFKARLCVDNRVRSLIVAPLVLKTFVGLCPPRMECCHGDGDKENNFLSNLRWDTRKKNAEDRVAHGTQVKGTKHPLSKLDEDAVREIRKLAGTMREEDIAALFGVERTTMRRARDGITWAHVV